MNTITNNKMKASQIPQIVAPKTIKQISREVDTTTKRYISGNVANNRKAVKILDKIDKIVSKAQTRERDTQRRLARVHKPKPTLELQIGLPTFNVKLGPDVKFTEQLNSLKASITSLGDKVPDNILGRINDMFDKISNVSSVTQTFIKTALPLLFLLVSVVMYIYTDNQSVKNWMTGLLAIGSIGTGVLFSHEILDLIKKYLFDHEEMKSIREQQDEFSDAEPQVGIEDSASLLGMLLSVMSLGLAGKKLSADSIRKFCVDTAGWHSKKRDFASLITWISEFFVKAFNWIREKCFGLGKIKGFVSFSEDVERWIDRVDNIHERFYTGRLEIKTLAADELWNLEMSGNELLMKQCRLGNSSGDVKIVITKKMDVLKKIMAPFYSARVMGGGPRMVPLFLVISGAPGVGKTNMLIPFINALLARVLPDHQLDDFKANWQDFVYQRYPEHKYWDGYRAQFATLLDDYGQAKDMQGQPDNEYMDTIRTIGPFPLICHMADLAQKGNTLFRSKIVIANTNMSTFRPNSIHEHEALTRRMWFVKCYPRMEYCVEPLPPQAQSRRLDVNKIPRGDVMNKDIYEFVPCGQDLRPVDGVTLSYEELLDLAVVKYNKLLSESDKYLDFLTNDLVSEIGKRRACSAGNSEVDVLHGLDNYTDTSSAYGSNSVDTSMDCAEVQSGIFTKVKDLIFTPDDNEQYERFIDDLIVKKDIVKAETRQQFSTCKMAFKRKPPVKIDVEYRQFLATWWSKTSEFDKDRFIAWFVDNPVTSGYAKMLPSRLAYALYRYNPELYHTALRTDDFDQYFELLEEFDIPLVLVQDYFTIQPLYDDSYGESMIITRQFKSMLARARTWIDGFIQRHPVLSIFGALTTGILVIGPLLSMFFESIFDRMLPGVSAASSIDRAIKSSQKASRLIGDGDLKFCEFTDRRTGGVFQAIVTKATMGVLSSAYLIRDCTSICQSKLDSSVSSLFDLPGFSPLIIPRNNTVVVPVKPRFVVGDDEDVLEPIAVPEKYDEAGRVRQRNQLSKPARGRQRIVRDKILTIQSCADLNSYQLGQSIVRKNLYSLYVIGNEKEFYYGSVTFVHDSWIIMPYHFIVEMKHAMSEFLPTICLESAFDEDVYEIEASVFLSGFVPLKKHEGMDLAMVNLTMVPKKPSILHHFASELLLSQRQIFEISLYTPTNYGIMCSCSQGEVEVERKVADDKSTWTLPRSVWYSVPTMKGDCGAICLLNEPSIAKKIIGFHVAGLPGKVGGASTIVTYDDIFPVIEPTMMEAQSGGRTIPFQGNFEFVRTAPSPGRNMKTQIERSPLHEVWGPSAKRPAILGRATIDGRIVDPLIPAIEKYGKVFNPINEKPVQLALKQLRRTFVRGYRDTGPPRVFDVTESILGKPGFLFFDSIPRTTSMGYPWVLRNPPGHRGKQALFGKDDTFNLNTTFCLELLRAVDADVALMKKGILPEYIYIDVLKDELRKHAKVDLGVTRLVSAAPIQQSIVFRMYFMDFFRYFMLNRIKNGSAVGVNVHSIEWSHIADRLKTHPHVLAFDVKNQDGSLHPVILNMILDYVIQPYYDDGDVNYRVRKMLWETVVNSKHIYNDIVYQWFGKMPSGNGGTTIINTLYTLTCHILAWIHLNPRGSLGIVDFDDHVVSQAYGDDSLICVSDYAIDRYNQETIPKVLSSYDITYTIESKDDKTCMSRELTEVTFLKRSFYMHPVLERIVAPLDLETILEIPYWTKKGFHRDQIVRDNVDVCLLELSYHDPAIFADWAPQIIKKSEDILKYSPKLVDYALLSRTLSARDDYI